MPLDNTDGQLVAKNLTGTVQVKFGSGRVVMVSQLTVGALALHDCATTGEAAAANQIAAIASGVGVVEVNMPFLLGLVLVAGAATVSISYN